MRHIPWLKMPGIDLSLATHNLRERNNTHFILMRKREKPGLGSVSKKVWQRRGERRALRKQRDSWSWHGSTAKEQLIQPEQLLPRTSNLGQHTWGLSAKTWSFFPLASTLVSSGPFKCRSTSLYFKVITCIPLQKLSQVVDLTPGECRLVGTSLILSRILENWKLPQNTGLPISWLLGYFRHRIKCIQSRSQLRNSSRTNPATCQVNQ